jgi:hypothetical protein
MNNTGIGEGVKEYSVCAKCCNCGYSGQLTSPKGKLVEGYYTCPNCGCLKFAKVEVPYNVAE